MKKRLFLLICFSFFFLCHGVSALGVTCGATYEKTRAPKLLNGKVAYCAAAKKNISCSDNSYTKIASWKKSNACSYRYNKNGKKVTKKNVDCSVMTGYVIEAAKKYAKNPESNKQDYVFIQRAEQTYLKEYGGDYWGSSNKSYMNTKYKNKKIRDIIKEAWNEYKKYKADICTSSKTTTNLKVNLKVEGNDNGLYYNNGEYISYKITATVTGASGLSDVKINISVSDKNLRLCTGTSTCSFNQKEGATSIEIKGTSGSFYIVTKKATDIVNKKVTNYSPSITAFASGTSKKSQCTFKYPDTSMYKSAKYPDFQKLIVLETKEKNGTVEEEVISDEVTSQFVVYPVIVSKCSDSYNGWSTNENADSNKQSIVCQDNNTGVMNNKNYKANFKSCKSGNKSINYYYKNKGKCVRGSASTDYNIGLQGEFVYGGVNGDTTPKIVKGQGFYLKNNNTYTVQASWKRALTYTNGGAYFGLPYTGTVHHNTIVYSADDSNCSRAGQKFDDYANAQIKTLEVTPNKDNDLSEIFETYVNDDSKLEKVPSIVAKEGNIDALKEKEAKTIKYSFSTPYAYFLVNKNIEYSVKELPKNNERVVAGNRYYTLEKYDKDTYPFNIGEANVSIYKNITWKLTGTCSIPVGTEGNNGGDDCPELYKKNSDGKYSLNVSYRPISVSNPFPKKVAKNWEEIIKNPTSMNRIKNTFNSKIFYSITFEKSAVDNIASENNKKKNYKSFEGISSDGVSSMVSEKFNIKNNASSYCALGYFSSECDNY